MERLHKILARSGIGSRRKCEQYILDGRVSVNGSLVSKVGSSADPDKDRIEFDGKPIKLEEKIYLVLHKPKGVCCTNAADSNLPRAIDLVPDFGSRLYTVGRLDVDSEGLILLTNDGALTQRLTHPSFKIPKTYEVHLGGAVSTEDLTKIEKGVTLSDGRTGTSKIRLKRRTRDATVLEISVREGRNRLVRRIFARRKLNVKRLKRISIGKMQLGKLKPGMSKRVSKKTIERYFSSSIKK